MNTLQIILVVSGYLIIGVIAAVLFFMNEMKNGDFNNDYENSNYSTAVAFVFLWLIIYIFGFIFFIGDSIAKVVIAIANALYRRFILKNRQRNRRK